MNPIQAAAFRAETLRILDSYRDDAIALLKEMLRARGDAPGLNHEELQDAIRYCLLRAIR